MCLELVGPCKTLWTVSTWVRLCTSVNTNMTLQIWLCFTQPQYGHSYKLLQKCTRLLCVCRWPYWLKLLSHTEHFYGFSLVWTLMCLFRSPDWLNALSHIGHLYGLSPVWTLMCTFRFPENLNALSHMEHLYGLTPVWTLMWPFRYPDVLNALSHMWHLYGFVLLWILLCPTRCPASVNRLLQTLHSNGFSPVWTRLCCLKLWLLPKHFPHSVHLYLLLCAFICLLKDCWCRKRFWHRVHE